MPEHRRNPAAGSIRHLGIRLRLLAYFLLAAALPLFVFTYLEFNYANRELTRQTEARLLGIAEDKIKAILDYISRRERNATTFAKSPTAHDALERFAPAYERYGLDSPVYQNVRTTLAPFLEYYQEHEGFYDLFLIAPEGDVIYSVKREADLGTNLATGPHKDTELARVFLTAKMTLDTHTSNFKHYRPSDRPAAFIAAPVLRKDRLLGVTAFQIDADEIYALAQDYLGLGRTGEIVIAMLEGEQILVIAPLREEPDAAFRKRIPVANSSSARLPIERALRGSEGSGIALDHRGKEVFAVWRQLPRLGGAIVVKIDKVEALAPVTGLRNHAVVVGTVGMLVAVGAALLVSHSLSQPIRKLRNGVEALARGDLEHRTGVTSNDEIGDLSRAFDEMIGDLQEVTASRDELDQEIQARKAMQQRLELTVKELERSNADLEQFAYICSHDLQEPLRMVTSYLSLIRKRYGARLDQDGDQFIEFALDGARRMQRLVQDLLQYSRVGRQKASPALTDTNELLERVIMSLSNEVQRSNATITHDSLPSVYAESSQLTQVFQNLISNALKFQSDSPPRIHVSCIKREREFEFAVRDNGIGVEPESCEQIFQLFRRLHSSNEYPGTGIGLAICKKVVERCGGRIWVEPNSEAGSTFRFTLPATMPPVTA